MEPVTQKNRFLNLAWGLLLTFQSHFYIYCNIHFSFLKKDLFLFMRKTHGAGVEKQRQRLRDYATECSTAEVHSARSPRARLTGG